MKVRLAPCATTLAVILLTACGGGGGGSDDKRTPPPEPPPTGGTTDPVPRTINGKLVMPNGETPLSNGLVYLPADAEAAKAVVSRKIRHQPAHATSATEGSCGTPPVPVVAHACTRSDGSFTLEATLPAGGFPLVTHKGLFTTQVEVIIGTDTTVAMEPMKVEIGNVKMAVVAGTFDRLEAVLANIGFGELELGVQLKYGTEQFDLYDDDGGLAEGYRAGLIPKLYPLFEELFVARGDGSLPLNDYDIIFINCGASEIFAATKPAVISTALREYVRQGGRLYVTDRAYDFVEQAIPEFIDFHGSEDTDEDKPEYTDAAQMGLDMGTVNASFTATDNADSLKDYLQAASCGGTCLEADGTIKIRGLLDHWAVIDGVHPAHAPDTTIWVEGPATYGTYESSSDGIKPLTVSYRFGEGMVMFSSYHTHGLNTSAQQKILEYLVFEMN